PSTPRPARPLPTRRGRRSGAAPPPARPSAPPRRVLPAPCFQRHCRSAAYRGTGRQLAPDGRHLTCTDGCGSGRVTLLGSWELATVPVAPIQRVRLLRRADGYYAQFVLQVERHVTHVPTSRVVGIDVVVHVSLLDCEGQAIANRRFIHHLEQRVRRRSRRLAR